MRFIPLLRIINNNCSTIYMSRQSLCHFFITVHSPPLMSTGAVRFKHACTRSSTIAKPVAPELDGGELMESNTGHSRRHRRLLHNVSILGEKSGKYLCMNSRGKVYGSVSIYMRVPFKFMQQGGGRSHREVRASTIITRF